MLLRRHAVFSSAIEILDAFDIEMCGCLVLDIPMAVEAMRCGALTACPNESERTVEVHRAHVMEKLGVETLAQLVRFKIAAESIADSE